VVDATFGGGIQYVINASRVVTASRNFMTLTNDSVIANWTDFGDGFSVAGSNPTHTYQADGEYEIKSYYYVENGNKILVQAQKITLLNGTVTYNPVDTLNPSGMFRAVSRTYKKLVNTYFANYCDNVLVGSPYTVNGTPAVLVGTLSANKPPVIDDLEDAGDFDPALPVSRTDTQHMTLVSPVTGVAVSPERKIIVTSTYASGSSVPVNSYIDMITGVAWTGNPATELRDIPSPAIELTKLVQSLVNTTYTVPAGYKSVSITSLTSGVTIDGVTIPSQFTWSVSSSHNERYSDTVLIGATGSYIVTEVR
jgi:hypothetical protein